MVAFADPGRRASSSNADGLGIQRRRPIHLHAILVTHVLGISAFYHDSAAAILRDGELIAAAQEERFTRKKHDSAFPRRAIDCCLAEAGIKESQLDYVA